MDGEPDNARACFRSGEFEDSVTEDQQYRGRLCAARITWTAWPPRNSAATARMPSSARKAVHRGIKPPPYNPKANVLFFLEFGPGPRKYATGQYREELRFSVPPSPVHSADDQGGSAQTSPWPRRTISVSRPRRAAGGSWTMCWRTRRCSRPPRTSPATSPSSAGCDGRGERATSTAQEVGLGIAAAGLVTQDRFRRRTLPPPTRAPGTTCRVT